MRLLTFMTFVTFDKSSFIHVSNRNTRVRELLQSYSISNADELFAFHSNNKPIRKRNPTDNWFIYFASTKCKSS